MTLLSTLSDLQEHVQVIGRGAKFGSCRIRPKFVPLSVKKITEDRQCGFELFLFCCGNHYFHMKNTFIPDLQNGRDILVVLSKHVSIFQWFYISFAQPRHGAREAGDSKAWNK